MRIVFLSHVDFNLYLFRLPIMKAMVEAGWEVYALCPEGEYSKRFQDDGIMHVPYKIDRSSLNPFKEITTIRNIAKVLREINPEILHTFTVKPNIYGTIAGKLAGTKKIYCSITGLGSFFIEKSLQAMIVRGIITSLYRIIFKMADGVVFQNSDDLTLFIEKNIVSREKTYLIKGSGIDTGLWEGKKHSAHAGKTVLFIGRLLIHKGIREFIQAARSVKEKVPETRFVVAGDYDRGNPFNLEKETMDNAIKEGTVTFLGWQSDVRPLYEMSDIFVLPSYREGMPRTAIEAASMSLPIVTTDTVGCREVVDDGVNGFLVPVGDHVLLAAKILTLLNDDKLYEKMAQKSREKAVAEFDIQTIVAQHLSLYNGA